MSTVEFEITYTTWEDDDSEETYSSGLDDWEDEVDDLLSCNDSDEDQE